MCVQNHVPEKLVLGADLPSPPSPPDNNNDDDGGPAGPSDDSRYAGEQLAGQGFDRFPPTGPYVYPTDRAQVTNSNLASVPSTNNRFK